jgi:hypothetical protein
VSSGSPVSKKSKPSTSKTSRKPRPKSASAKSSASGKPGLATTRLNEDWLEFLRALISSGTKFLLIGGHALAIHAERRFTEDLELSAATSSAIRVSPASALPPDAAKQELPRKRAQAVSRLREAHHAKRGEGLDAAEHAGTIERQSRSGSGRGIIGIGRAKNGQCASRPATLPT